MNRFFGRTVGEGTLSTDPEALALNSHPTTSRRRRFLEFTEPRVPEVNGTRFRPYPLINHGLSIVDDPRFIPSDGIENVGLGNEWLQLSFLDDIRDQAGTVRAPRHVLQTEVALPPFPQVKVGGAPRP